MVYVDFKRYHMQTKNKLQTVSQKGKLGSHSVIKLLLADHKLLRSLMKQVKSHKATSKESIKAFTTLKKAVLSHVKAEETTFLTLIKDNPKFADHVLEGFLRSLGTSLR
jgi:ABC-type lipoprotein release transport system permease subunit